MHTPAGFAIRRQGLAQRQGLAHRALHKYGVAGLQKGGNIGGRNGFWHDSPMVPNNKERASKPAHASV